MISSGDIPVYGGNGVTGYHDKSNVSSNTLVIGRVGFYCGSVHYIETDAWVTDNALIVSYEKKLDTRYLFYLLKNTNLRQNESSTAQPVISGKKIYGIQVRTTGIEEQKEIVRILDELFAKEQQAQAAVETVLANIDTMKKSILARAFRGELGTNDSTDESARELLRRVL